MSQPTEIDSFDRAILDILQRDNMTPMRIIGEAVNLSTAAVQRRIKRLNETGVISSNVAVVDPEKLGLPITIVTCVELENERYDFLAEMMRQYRTVPEVQQCYNVTGEVSFIVIMVVSSMAEYQALSRRLFHDNPNVLRFQTYVVLDRVKTGLSLPIKS